MHYIVGTSFSVAPNNKSTLSPDRRFKVGHTYTLSRILKNEDSFTYTFVCANDRSKLEIIFKTCNDDWAICCGSRDSKISYHIMSKKYKMSLNDIRILANKIDKPYIDTTAYWFSMNYSYDEGSLRLPNQSKHSINKEGTPMKILQGDISDFFVTETDTLKLYIPK